MVPSSSVSSSHITVLVADSNRMRAQLLTSALRRRPEFRITTCLMDPAAVSHVAASTPIQVAVLTLDHHSSAWESMAALRRVHVSHPEMAKVLLVEASDRELVVSALRSGVRGIFCFHDAPFRFLCKCIQCVARGQIWLNTEQMNYLVDLVTQAPSLRVVNSRGARLLTPREEQVVALVAEGLSNREIARELNLSHHTVKKYLFRIFDKLGISTRVELVLYAVSHGDHCPAEWVAGAPVHSVHRALPAPGSAKTVPAKHHPAELRRPSQSR